MKRLPCSRTLVSIACVLSLWVAPASHGLDKSIPSQPLNLALRRFAQHSGLQVIYVSQIAAGQRSAGAPAGLSLVATLERLLAGTGLHPEFANDRTVMIVGGSSAATAARGQDVPAVQSSVRAENPVLEEVVVTAERRRNDLQNTTLSMTSVTGARIEQQAITSLSAAMQPVAGVVMQGDVGRFNVAIRGIGTNSPPNAAETTVALTADGIYNDLQVNTAANLFDIDRVEVLRGPQGTLYGRNAAAGAVNIISNNPVSYFDASGRIEFGNYQLRHLSGVLNAPLTEHWSSRLAINHLAHRGYLSNGQNDQDSRAARLKFQYQPDEKLSLLLSAAYERMDGSTGTVAAFSAQPADPWLNTERTDNFSRSTLQTWSAQANYDFGKARLTVLPAYQYRDTRQSFYSAGTGPNQTSNNLAQKSLEVRLSESMDSPLKWVAGAYVYGSSGVVNFSSGPSWYTIDSVAAFGQLTIPVGANWHGVVGARLTNDRKSRTRSNSQFAGRWNKLDYKAGVSRQLGGEALAYIQYATGYRPGGVFESRPGVFVPYDPEQVHSWESGLKSRWLTDRLQINADVFTYDYRDYQASGAQSNGGMVIFNYQNTPGARVSGSELEAVMLPGRRNRIELSLGYLETRFKQGFINNGVDYSGQPLGNSPRWNGSVRYEHHWPVPAAQITASAELIGKTGYFLNFAQQPHSRQPGYFQANLAASYQSSDGQWQINAWVRNAGNYAVRTAYITTPLAEYLVIAPPRTWGLGVSFNY